MTERRGAPFDDQATPPAPSGDLPEGGADASGTLSLRPRGDNPEPASAGQNQWGAPPPAAGSAALSGAPAPEWVRGRGDTPRPGGGPDWRAPGEPVGPEPASGQRDAAQHAGSRVDASGSPGQQPSTSGSAARPRPGAAAERPGPSWQQPVGAYSEEGRGWSQAQGSAADWNYLEDLRSGELVPTRRIPPGRGWRKAVYVASFKLINLGQSPDERYQAELDAKIRSLLRGTYKIGVLGKGGVGKSTLAASVGSVFAELRKDDRVVAIDADTAFGKLASLIDPTTSGSYWELASDRYLFSFADIRSRVGSNKVGLFVLAGETATAGRRVLDAEIYREATTQLDKHFTLSIVDCGSSLDSPVTQEVLAGVDALIVVSSPWYDGASAAAQALDWLANHGFTGLLHRTVVVVNDSDGHSTRRDRALLVERFGKRGQKVIEMPFDEHLRPGGVIDVKEELNPITRRRLMELAAACAEHFTATADRPRRVR